jgi:hypothetical protein
VAALVVAAGTIGCGREAPAPATAARVATATVPKSPPKPPAPAVAIAVPPAAPAVAIAPASWTLRPGDDGLQFLALPAAAGAITWRAVPDGVLAIERDGYARARAAGRARVEAVVGGATVGTAEVTVDAGADRPWDFATDIVPIFTRYGCNTGGCHGRAAGQNGFHLSLFGYDAAGDYQAVTRGAGGRRVDAIAPGESLLVRKATGRTPHVGGRRLPPDSDACRTLVEWVRAGAPEARGAAHGAVVAVTVEPPRVVLDAPRAQQLRVVARHVDGHLRDVTRLATYRTNDDGTAVVDDRGFAALGRRGETDLVVRFGAAVVPVRIGAVINPDLRYDFASLPRVNAIDTELFRRLEELKVPPSPPADDANFLRRASLDLTGGQPLPEEVRAFLDDRAADKRARKVDELMARPEFLKHWEIRLGDLLQITSARFQNGAGHYHEWLETRLRENARWDAMARELLTALGNPNRKGGGPANYALDGADATAKAEQTAQRFLGLRMRCAQCHDHPFDIWTQDDYYGLAAFFAKAGLGAGPGMAMGRPEVRVDPKGVVNHLRTGRPAVPRFPRGEAPPVGPDEDPRRALANWMTRPDNPYFARAMANWMWSQFFGRGLAEPADDLGAANPPVHPALLDALAREFVAGGYDLRALIRLIVTSTAYGLSSEPVPGNAADARLFSHHAPRPLSAQQVADAIAQATDVPNVYANRARGTRALDVFDPATPSAILDAFGRCPRTTACRPVATPSLSLRQTLLLIGGDAIDGKVSSLNGYLARLLEYGAEPSDVVENLYLRTVCRPPTDAERSHWTAELAGAASLSEAAEDLFWSLLNSREFAFNH